MTTQDLFKATSPTQNISDSVFNALIKARKNEINDSVNDFGFYSKVETHEIYALLIDGNVEIERFGFTVNGNWIDLKITAKQLKLVEDLLIEQKGEIAADENYDSEPVRYRDMYKETGTKPSNFY